MSGRARKQPVIWAVLRVLQAVFNILPHRAAVALGGALGGVTRAFSSKRAAKAVSRCSRVLGVDERRAHEIVSEAYGHFGRAAAEFLRLPKMSGRMDELFDVEGEEHLRDACALGKGVIFLSAHIGNWEYGAAIMALHGFRMNAIGADQRDVRITEAIAGLRRSSGVKPIGKGFDLKSAISCLRRGEVLAVLLDQDARDAGIVSPFLGVPASTPVGPLKMAHKLGSPIVPVRVIRQADGVRFKMIIEPPLAGSGKPFGEDLQEAADACNERISSWIREYPGQWLWMYPRWATTTGDR